MPEISESLVCGCQLKHLHVLSTCAHNDIADLVSSSGKRATKKLYCLSEHGLGNDTAALVKAFFLLDVSHGHNTEHHLGVEITLLLTEF